MSGYSVLLIVMLLNIKHYIVEFLPLTREQYKYRGVFGHPMGFIHPFMHGLVSYIILGIIFDYLNYIVILVCLGEAVTHYTIDYKEGCAIKIANKQLNARVCIQRLRGLDQLLHNVTYLIMIYFLL